MASTVTITKKEYARLKDLEAQVDVVRQVRESLEDVKNDRIRRVA